MLSFKDFQAVQYAGGETEQQDRNAWKRHHGVVGEDVEKTNSVADHFSKLAYASKGPDAHKHHELALNAHKLKIRNHAADTPEYNAHARMITRHSEWLKKNPKQQ